MKVFHDFTCVVEKNLSLIWYVLGFSQLHFTCTVRLPFSFSLVCWVVFKYDRSGMMHDVMLSH
jgi:hypothetical protein